MIFLFAPRESSATFLAVCSMIGHGSTIIGQSIAGPLADTRGIPTCFLAAACITATMVLPIYFFTDPRHDPVTKKLAEQAAAAAAAEADDAEGAPSLVLKQDPGGGGGDAAVLVIRNPFSLSAAAATAAGGASPLSPGGAGASGSSSRRLLSGAAALATRGQIHGADPDGADAALHAKTAGAGTLGDARRVAVVKQLRSAYRGAAAAVAAPAAGPQTPLAAGRGDGARATSAMRVDDDASDDVCAAQQDGELDVDAHGEGMQSVAAQGAGIATAASSADAEPLLPDAPPVEAGGQPRSSRGLTNVGAAMREAGLGASARTGGAADGGDSGGEGTPSPADPETPGPLA